MFLRHRHEDAVALPRGLPTGLEIPDKKFSPPPPDGECAPLPAQICQVRAGAVVKRREAPVPRVLLSIPLAATEPSGSTDTSGRCQGRSRPPRYHSGQAALSSTSLLRQAAVKVSHLHTNHGATRRRSRPQRPPRALYPAARSRAWAPSVQRPRLRIHRPRHLACTPDASIRRGVSSGRNPSYAPGSASAPYQRSSGRRGVHGPRARRGFRAARSPWNRQWPPDSIRPCLSRRHSC